MKRKSLMLVLVIGLFVSGCASLSTMEKVQNRFGPPAKVEQLENGNSAHYYYKACNEYDCLCNVFIYNPKGKVVGKRRYWTQGVPDVIKGGQK
jgi:hypothetical protein